MKILKDIYVKKNELLFKFKLEKSCIYKFRDKIIIFNSLIFFIKHFETQI